MKCEMIDRTFGNFEMCRIKAVNRTHKYIDINLKLYILPINNIMVSAVNFMKVLTISYKISRLN